MKSMTGYGRAEYKDNSIEILVEVRTVNNRNLDVNAKLPRALAGLEDALRKCAQAKLSRGRADIFVSFKDNREKPAALAVDFALAESYLNAAKELSARFGVENDYTVSSLMKLPDVVKDAGSFEDYSEFEGPLVRAANAALDDLNAITHRYVRAEVRARLRAWARQGGTVAAIDAIALIESGLAELCTVTIGVTAPREQRIERLIAREGVTRDYAEARIDAQKPNEWFVQNCSHVLDNGGTLADFQRCCHQLIQEVLS